MAAVIPQASGVPPRSLMRWILAPGLPRSTGPGPVSSPLFGAYRERVHHRPIPSQTAGGVRSVEHRTVQHGPQSHLGPLGEPAVRGGPRHPEHGGRQLPPRTAGLGSGTRSPRAPPGRRPGAGHRLAADAEPEESTVRRSPTTLREPTAVSHARPYPTRTAEPTPPPNKTRSKHPSSTSKTDNVPSSNVSHESKGEPLERQVNERQLSVLKWVGEGCPAGVWETISYKTTCQALQNRGLVKVSRKGGQWSVALTSAGRTT